MDSVRFGRALGFGARAAAKTLVTAVDAATAPNPSGARKAADGPQTANLAGDSTAARLGQKAAQTTVQVKQTGQGLKRGGKRFGEAVWGPFVKASNQLWLEFTGVFFGIFANAGFLLKEIKMSRQLVRIIYNFSNCFNLCIGGRFINQPLASLSSNKRHRRVAGKG